MQVIYLVADFDLATEGAASRASLQAQALARRGAEVRVLAGTGVAADIESSRAEGLEVDLIPGWESKSELGLGSMPTRVARDLAAADLVHVHLGQPLYGDVARKLSGEVRVWMQLDDWQVACPRGNRMPSDARITCPKGGATEACGSCLSGGSDRQTTAEIASQARVRADELAADLRSAGRVLVPSRTHLVRLAEHVELEPSRVRIVSPDQGFARAVDPRTPWRGDGPLRLFYSGPRRTQAGLLELVRGLAELPAGRVHLTLVGREVERGFDERLRTLGGNLTLEFADSSPALLRRHAARSHLAVQPSRIEQGYPLGVDQAMALGLPVLACNASAAMERYAGEGLELLPARDPEGWTERIESFLRRPNELAQLTLSLPDQISGPNQTAERLLSLIQNHSSPSRNRAS